MDDIHRVAIQKNYKELVSKVNLNELLPSLIERRVFLYEQAENYRNQNIAEKERKRNLFLDIQRRGPEAFPNLIESLKCIDHEHKKLAYKLQEQEMPEIDNNNYEDDSEAERQMLSTCSKGARPFILTEEQRPPHIRQLSQEIPKANINLGTEPLKVKVKACESWCDNQNEHKIPVYTMRSKQRGIFLGINNIEFGPAHDKRCGAEVDEDNLKDLFKQMGFRIETHRNQSRLDMKTTFLDFVANQTILGPVDCVVVAVMSHGIDGSTEESSEIITSDAKKIQVSWILEQFNNINCPALINKPKIFIFQICRGDNPHSGVRVQANHPRVKKQTQNCMQRIQSDGISAGQIVRNAEDMLIAFSTLPGDRSYRDTCLGTWYMQAICKAFMEHAHDTDIENLLKVVDYNLKHLRSADGNMQTSSYENRGFRLCYLHPGIYQDENNQMRKYNE